MAVEGRRPVASTKSDEVCTWGRPTVRSPWCSLVFGVGLHTCQFMGTAIGSAVVPLWNLLTWKKAKRLGTLNCNLVGNVVALGSSALIHAVL